MYPAKVFPVQCLPIILHNYYFLLQIPLRLSMHFFDTIRLLIPLSPRCRISLSCHFIPYSRVRVTH